MSIVTTQPSEYVTLWKLCKGNRATMSRVITFLCQHDFGLLRISAADFAWINSAFQSNPDVRYRWSKTSHHVEQIASRLQVHHKSVLSFLKARGFDARVATNPKRQRRDTWIEKIWNVIP